MTSPWKYSTSTSSVYLAGRLPAHRSAVARRYGGRHPNPPRTVSIGDAPRASAGGLRLGVLLTSAMALSTITQFAIGALGPAIRGDLGVSRAALGGLSATYYLVAAVLSRPLGWRIDTVSARVALIVVFAGTALAMAVAATVGSYAGLLLAVLPAGAATAAANPVTNRIIAHLPGRHGTLVAVKQSGVQLGALAAGAVLPILAVAIGWRGALACVGAACVAAVAMTSWTPRLDGSERDEPGDEPVQRSRGVVTLAAYAFFMGAGMSTVTTYLPLYGHDRVGFSQAAAGSLLALVGVGGVVSRLWWTRLHERRAGGDRGALDILMALAAAAFAATLAVIAAEATGAWLLWLAAGLLGLSAAAWNALAMLAVLEQTPAAFAAGTSGTVLAAFYLGLCVAAPVFGLAVDAAGAYEAGWALTATSFALAAATAWRTSRA
jgi:predicted MFS family arabinose efflux permease